MSRRSAHLALLVLVPLLAYSAGFFNGFVWDDHRVIEKGQLIHSLKNIPILFYHDAQFNSLGEGYEKIATLDTYRPITLTSFFFEYAIFGLQPFWYHLTSILIHIGCVLLLYAVARQLRANPLAALFGALLFAVHPSISEAVHWINGRSDPLSLLFFLAGLMLWLRGRFWWSIPCWIASTMCKETSFILLFTLPLLYQPITERVGRRFTPWLAIALGFALGFGFRLVGLKRPAITGGGFHIWYAARRVLALWFDDLVSLVRPKAEMPPSLYEKYLHPQSWKIVLAAIIVAVLLYWFWRRRTRDPIGLWFFVTALGLWAPVSLLTLQEGWFGWGRYLYTSAALFALWLALMLTQVPLCAELLTRRAVQITLAVALALLALQTFMTGHDWKNDRTFAEGILLDHPEQSVGYSELAVIELHEGHADRALPLIEKAITMQPGNYFHWSRAADALMKLGRPQEAFVAAQKALRIAPRDVGARFVAAIGFLGQNQEVPAARLLLGALLDDPDHQEGPWLILKQALARKGPNSEFASEVNRIISEPRFSPIRSRTLALLRSTFGQ